MPTESPFDGEKLSSGQCATLACLFEATAPKPGNVHRGADFEDLSYPDLVTSGIVIGPVLDGAAERRLGETILAAVRATRQAVGTNSNLGMILLLAPLAAVPRGMAWSTGLAAVFSRLDSEDARLVYEAIRLAQPGGLGTVETADIVGPAPTDLLAAMRAAAERDLIARQYANGFQEVLECVVPALRAGLDQQWSLPDTIVHTQLTMLSRFPDSLIARKCGAAVAQQASDRAAAVLTAGTPTDEAYWQALGDLDFWLRSDGHRRNPGTTADLIAAGLFMLLADGIMKPPWRWGSGGE